MFETNIKLNEIRKKKFDFFKKTNVCYFSINN